jgi:hypothetical protein
VKPENAWSRQSFLSSVCPFPENLMTHYSLGMARNPKRSSLLKFFDVSCRNVMAQYPLGTERNPKTPSVFKVFYCAYASGPKTK